jgi:hypothetical protein
MTPALLLVNVLPLRSSSKKDIDKLYQRDPIAADHVRLGGVARFLSFNQSDSLTVTHLHSKYPGLPSRALYLTASAILI